jgi:Uma2 family endonuclease
MVTATLAPSPNRVLLQNISWQTYELLLKDLENNSGIRLTYDRGKLEIMTPSDPHETYKELINRFVQDLTVELNIEIRSLGSRTCNRKDLTRGLEPDQCYYIQNEAVVRHLERINLNENPPPDLAIEIDISSSSVDRLDIYAALGVPEVWRYDGSRLIILRLENGEYKECESSPTLPQLPPSEVVRFLELRQTMGETSLMRLFRDWVRSQVQH